MQEWNKINGQTIERYEAEIMRSISNVSQPRVKDRGDIDKPILMN